MVPSVSLAAKLTWLREFGSPASVLAQPLSALKQHSDEARPLQKQVEPELIDGVLDWCATSGGRCVFFGDDEYPLRLLDRLADPPLVVYALGDMDLLAGRLVALLGSPRPSARGAERARSFALELAREGACTIAAGVVPGIASAAHQGAQAASRPSVGVVGNSASWEGVRLAENIAGAGLLLSELPPRSPTGKTGFARRHRLLAALADLCVVVETHATCDTMGQVNDAVHMGCEIAAVPADPDFREGRGCNLLLREGAALVESSADVAMLLN